MPTGRALACLRAFVARSRSLVPLALIGLACVPALAAAASTEDAPGALSVHVRPSAVRPGDVFEVAVSGAGLRDAQAQIGKERFALYESSPGTFRGFGAVPMTATPGALAVRVTAAPASGGAALRGDAALDVRDYTWDERTMRVAARFTHPSPAQQARMKADLAAFSRAYAVEDGPPLFDSNFASPREGAAINCRYGERRVFNGALQSRHQGLDLDGQNGEPVYAANDGVVRMVRPCFAAGNAVMLSHGGGLFTSYFHLSRFAVSAGQRVKRGELLGYVGSTGRVTGPHLHLSAKLHGVMVDPESLLAFDFFPTKAASITSAR